MTKYLPKVILPAYKSAVRAALPVIDGELLPATEWDEATSFQLTAGGPKVYIMNDDKFLYVAFDKASVDSFAAFNVYKAGAYTPERLDSPVINFDGRKMWDTLTDVDGDGTFESYSRSEDSGLFKAARGTVTEFRVPLANLKLAAGDAIKVMFVFFEAGVPHIYPVGADSPDPTTYADFTLPGVSQADVEIHEVKAPITGLIHSIQVYCRAIAATATCRVKKNGTAITSAITPVAGTPSVVAPTDPFVAAGDALTVHVTTDNTGSFKDLTVLIIIKEQESITTI